MARTSDLSWSLCASAVIAGAAAISSVGSVIPEPV